MPTHGLPLLGRDAALDCSHISGHNKVLVAKPLVTLWIRLFALYVALVAAVVVVVLGLPNKDLQIP